MEEERQRGLKSNGEVELAERFIIFFLLLVRLSQVPVGVIVIRPQLNSLLEICNGFGILLTLNPRDAAIDEKVVGGLLIRLEAQGLVEISFRSREVQGGISVGS